MENSVIISCNNRRGIFKIGKAHTENLSVQFGLQHLTLLNHRDFINIVNCERGENRLTHSVLFLREKFTDEVYFLMRMRVPTVGQ